MSESEHDVVVLGAGPAGENVAWRAVDRGLTAVIVESELVGGECSYWACMPSKALLRPVQALAAARAVAGAREAVSGALAASAVLARRDAFAAHWNDAGQVAWLASERIPLIRGHGRLDGVRRVVVHGEAGDTVLRARHAVVVCTGSDAALPDVVPGLREARPWTSREATSARRVPASLAILGGGVVGCEMATAWRGLGAAEVTLVQRGPRLLPGLEPFAGEMVRSALEASGARVLVGAEASRVERDATGFRVACTDGTVIASEELLVATGRAPRTADVGLETISLRPGSWLEVDDGLCVTAVPGRWLYAVGDVNHRALLTHMGKYQGRVCGEAIARRARGDDDAPDASPWSRFAATADRAAVPQVVFTEPEVAAVGPTAEQLRAAGRDVRVVDYDLGRVAGASLFADGYTGRARALVDERRGVLAGMTLVGPGVGEMIHAATIAVVGEVPLDRLWHAVPSYPTMSEVWLRLLEELGL